MSGKIFDPGMGRYPLPGGAGSTNLSQSAICESGWGFHTAWSDIDSAGYRLPSLLELHMHRRIYDTVMRN